MKYLAIFITILTLHVVCYSQENYTDYDGIILVYREVSSPYLKAIAENKYKSYKPEERVGLVIAAHNALLAETRLLSAKVVTQINASDSLRTSSTKIIALLNDSYRKTFPDLPKRFFKEVKDELKKKGF